MSGPFHTHMILSRLIVTLIVSISLLVFPLQTFANTKVCVRYFHELGQMIESLFRRSAPPAQLPPTPLEEATARFLQRHAASLRESIGDERLPPSRLKILRILGWRLSEENEITAPNRMELANGYRRAVEILKTPANRRLDPVRTAKMPDGTYIDVPLDADLPNGARSTVGELPTEEIIRLISQGKFPIGEDPTELGTRGSVISFHDQIGHLAVYVEHPDLAEALIESAKLILLDKKGWPKEYGSVNAYNNKVRYALEYLVGSRVTPTEMADTIKLTQSLRNEPVLTVSRVISEDLSKKSTDELQAEAEHIYNNLSRVAQTLGGANTDALIFDFPKYGESRFRNATRPDRAYGFFDDIADALARAKSREELEIAIAKTKAYLMGLSRVTPAQLVRDILRPEIRLDSELYRLQCLSEVFVNLAGSTKCSEAKP